MDNADRIPGLKYPTNIPASVPIAVHQIIRNIYDNLLFDRKHIEDIAANLGKTVSGLQELIQQSVVQAITNATTNITNAGIVAHASTHAVRLVTYSSAADPVGSLFFETDRGSIYYITDAFGIPRWQFAAGMMVGPLGDRPTDLGSPDIGFSYTAIEDHLHSEYVWTGTGWITIGGQFGPPGMDGIDGEDGQVGPPGKDGIIGLDGAAGLPGPPGMDGSDGEDGVPGQMGSPGAPGASGAPGIPGSPGMDGLDGMDGQDGIPGNQGPQGTAGAAGAAGVAGMQGPPGDNGDDGLDGVPGQAGAQGVQGIQGIQGVQGPPGMDAYQPEDPLIIPGPPGPQGPAGGGGSGTTGSATLDFGATPGTNIASVAVIGQATITALSFVQAWIMGVDSTAEHNAYEHMIAPIKLSISNLIAGTGFTVNGITDWRLDGTFKVRWSWS